MEENDMKLAVSATGPDLGSPVDQRLGRARYLLIVDTPARTVQALENRAGMDATQGAGVQVAQSVINSQATVVVTGHCGPKAFRALHAAGVQVYLTPGGTVGEAIDQFEAGGLAEAQAADVNGHW
jgi:predicted Fe-Mo cluster-binding NifX family protein